MIHWILCSLDHDLKACSSETGNNFTADIREDRIYVARRQRRDMKKTRKISELISIIVSGILERKSSFRVAHSMVIKVLVRDHNFEFHSNTSARLSNWQK